MLRYLQKITSVLRELSSRESLEHLSIGPERKEDRFRLSFVRFVAEGEELSLPKHSEANRQPSTFSIESLIKRETLPAAPFGDLPPRRKFLRWLFTSEVLPNRIDASSQPGPDSILE